MSSEPTPKRPGKAQAWAVVPLVVALGALVGVLMSYLVPLPHAFGPFPQPFDQFRNLIVVHMVLSTVIIALQLALVIVYLRIYASTRARFALGILVVLAALLIQSFFQYPLVLGLGRFTLGFGPYLSAGDLIAIAAYTIFLYLSLD